MFRLHERLAAETFEVARWPLCRVLLMNDRTYPWLILVPERAGLKDLHDLDPADHGAVMAEIGRAARALQRLFKPDKINVAALGNVVVQLHVHVVARFTTDPAWPRPVWGVRAPEPYDQAGAGETIARLGRAFAEGD
ncbi:MAG: HIT domain-containing protein [Rhodospirillales bacterium]|nr:HIT domain-containing protein [Rhodospirillales bacterium]MSP80433.1 HIT domain-containing protein [Rhodospirillales bacterium]